jgi:uncharacterized membrane protein YqjE
MQRHEELIKPQAREESFTELLGNLATDSAALVRDELILARKELSEKISSLRNSIILIATGALVGLIALMTLCAAAVIGLAPYAGAWQSALIVGIALIIVAGVVSYTGVHHLKTTNLKPEQTLETLEEDKKWLKELT